MMRTCCLFSALLLGMPFVQPFNSLLATVRRQTYATAFQRSSDMEVKQYRRKNGRWLWYTCASKPGGLYREYSSSGRFMIQNHSILPWTHPSLSSLQASSSSSSSNHHNSNVTGRDSQYMLTVAIEAARMAGDIMKKTTGKISISKTKSNIADLVTESDVECQKVIRQVITSHFPCDPFLGEEDVKPGRAASVTALQTILDPTFLIDSENQAEGKGSDKYIWIVDPIDGTINFQAGLPMFCTSIGVIKVSTQNPTPEIIVGVVYNPILDEITSAIRGEGCFVNGDKVVPRNPGTTNRVTSSSEKNSCGIPLQHAIVNVGYNIASESTLAASSRAVAALATKVRGLRMIACAAQVMCWVAQGKLNAYIGWDLNAWDAAAGMLIIQESGGCIRNFDGSPANTISRDVIMTCNEGTNEDRHDLNDELRRILQEFNCLDYKKN